jgi:hypothetical protein
MGPPEKPGRGLRIGKEGGLYLRKLPDTDLNRWGLKLAERGGKNSKKRQPARTVPETAA